jgi:hypothetical protein
VFDTKLICKSGNDPIRVISVIGPRYKAISAETVSFFAIVGNRLCNGGISDSSRAENIEHSPAALGVENLIRYFLSQTLTSLWMAFWRRVASRGIVFGALDGF